MSASKYFQMKGGTIISFIDLMILPRRTGSQQVFDMPRPTLRLVLDYTALFREHNTCPPSPR